MSGQVEGLLLEALRQALNPKDDAQEFALPEEEYAKREFLKAAKEHAVMPLLFDAYEKMDENDGINSRYADFVQALRQAASTTARANYRLLFMVKYVTQLLGEEGICAIVLKGVATASCYPTPELRKSGDIDLLIPQGEDLQRAAEVLERANFTKCGTQLALHHVEMKNEEGISIELHRMLAEPFESQRMNRYLEALLPEFAANVKVNDSWGVAFYQPTDAYHAFYLVLHMLQHFLRAGFGLKFLCDWTVFWNREVGRQEKETFLRLVEESKTKGFVLALTQACVEYLGLRAENVAFLLEGSKKDAQGKYQGNADMQQLAEEFMQEVFASGEFGHSARQRMVAMRGTGTMAYVREFHHQMHLNYPCAGRVFVLWPLLWSMTLLRFLYNNRAVRKVRGRDILKEARRRSKLIGRMELFR